MGDSMHPNWRELQPINDRTIYECQEDVDAAHVDKDDDLIGDLIEAAEDGTTTMANGESVQSLVVMTQGSAVWMVVCIVFILLFGIALMAVAYLAGIVWKTKQEQSFGSDKDELGRHQYLASKGGHVPVSAGDDVLSKI